MQSTPRSFWTFAREMAALSANPDVTFALLLEQFDREHEHACNATRVIAEARLRSILYPVGVEQ